MSETSVNQLNLSGNVQEVIDSDELARRWNLPASWIREQTRSRAVDPLPCVRFGKYVRFSWGSRELENWLSRRRTHWRVR
jgi:hypothetical protein